MECLGLWDCLYTGAEGESVVSGWSLEVDGGAITEVESSRGQVWRRCWAAPCRSQDAFVLELEIDRGMGDRRLAV